MSPRIPPSYTVLVLWLMLAVAPARAETAHYELAGDFHIAAAPEIEIDFESEESPADESYSGGFAQAGLLISASDSYLFRRNYGPSTNGFLYGANGTRGAALHVWLPPGTAAFGANISTFHTLFTEQPGRVRVTLSTGPVYELSTSRWGSSGLGPASSFFGVVSTETLEWLRFESIASADPDEFGADAVLIDNIGVSLQIPETCEAELALCERSVSDCTDEKPLEDSDQDGVPDTSDQCAGTPPEDVDYAGCSREQFCANFSVEVGDIRSPCRRADWRNDEPIRARDCKLERTITAEGERSYRCVVR